MVPIRGVLNKTTCQLQLLIEYAKTDRLRKAKKVMLSF